MAGRLLGRLGSGYLPKNPSQAATNTWWDSTIIGTWYEIPNSSPSLLSIPALPGVKQGDGPRVLFDHWSGMAYREATKELLVCGGGHSNYAGNAVIGISLAEASPTWTIHTANSHPDDIIPASPFVPSPNGDPGYRRYLDGAITSYHSYTSNHYNDLYDELWVCGVGAYWGNGNGYGNHVERWSYQTKEWLPIEDCTLEATGFGYSGTGRCQHPVTKDVYAVQVGTSVLRRINFSDYTFTTIAGTNGGTEIDTPLAIDPTRSRLLKAPSHSVTSWRELNISTGADRVITLTGTLPPSNLSQCKLMYDSIGDRYIACTRTFALYAITPSLASTTWASSLISVTNTPPDAISSLNPAQSGINGLFDRAMFIPELKGIVIVPQYLSNVWFLRLYD
jgi:hypothetical protein